MKYLGRFLPVFCLIFILIGCQDDDLTPAPINQDDDLVLDQKPQPANSQEVNVIIDESLDFSEYEIHSLMDSISLDNPDEKLYAPEGFDSEVYAVDKNSGEIMAVGVLDSESNTVNFSPESVAKSLISLAPNYGSLDSQQRLELIDNLTIDETFTGFVEIIKSILNNKEPIYSDRSDFINQILLIDNYILEEFFPNQNEENDRVLLGNEEFLDFLKNKEGSGTVIVNRVSSYVNVEFKSQTDDSYSKKILLEPAPLISGFGPEIPPQANDDYFLVSINQTSGEAFKKNKEEATWLLAQTLLSALVGKISDNDLRSCVVGISSSLVLNHTKLKNDTNGNPTLSQMLVFVVKAVADATAKSIKDEKCDGLKAFLTNKTVILKAVAKKTNLLVNIYTFIKTADKVRKLSGYVLSLIDGTWVDLKQDVQQYQGNIIPAQLKVIDINSFEGEYQPGDKVLVKVQLEAQSSFGEWKKSGYKVSWSVRPMNGELDALFSETNEEGVATVLWTLPEQENAVVTLTAELNDREGDKFDGSPITFQLNVVEEQFDPEGVWIAVNYNAKGEKRQSNRITFDKDGNSLKSEVFKHLVTDPKWEPLGHKWTLKYNKNNNLLILRNLTFDTSHSFKVESLSATEFAAYSSLYRDLIRQ